VSQAKAFRVSCAHAAARWQNRLEKSFRRMVAALAATDAVAQPRSAIIRGRWNNVRALLRARIALLSADFARPAMWPAPDTGVVALLNEL